MLDTDAPLPYTDFRNDFSQEDTDDHGPLESRPRAGLDGNRPAQPDVRGVRGEHPRLDAHRRHLRNHRSRVRHQGRAARDEARRHPRHVREQRPDAHRRAQDRLRRRQRHVSPQRALLRQVQPLVHASGNGRRQQHQRLVQGWRADRARPAARGSEAAADRGRGVTIMSTQWDVMRELSTMQDRMNRIWGGLYDRGHAANGGHEDVSGHGAWLPPVDIYETAEKEIVIKAEVAGLKRDAIDLTVENNTLTIRGQRPAEEGAADAQFHRSERVFGAFSRSFTLPNTVDASKVKAEYRDGVLTVRLPRREEARPRQITVDVQG